MKSKDYPDGFPLCLFGDVSGEGVLDELGLLSFKLGSFSDLCFSLRGVAVPFLGEKIALRCFDFVL